MERNQELARETVGPWGDQIRGPIGEQGAIDAVAQALATARQEGRDEVIACASG